MHYLSRYKKQPMHSSKHGGCSSARLLAVPEMGQLATTWENEAACDSLWLIMLS